MQRGGGRAVFGQQPADARHESGVEKLACRDVDGDPRFGPHAVVPLRGVTNGRLQHPIVMLMMRPESSAIARKSAGATYSPLGRRQRNSASTSFVPSAEKLTLGLEQQLEFAALHGAPQALFHAEFQGRGFEELRAEEAQPGTSRCLGVKQRGIRSAQQGVRAALMVRIDRWLRR